MKLTERQKENFEFVDSVVKKAWEDLSFKQDLIDNPLSTIEKFTGRPIEIQAGKSLIVEDQTDENIIYLNIPFEPNLDDLELTDEQLALVAGGATPIVAVTICFTVGLVIGVRSNN